MFDLTEDPLERRNLVADAGSIDILDKMRSLMRTHLDSTEDDFEYLSWTAARRWRSHPVGYWKHRGIAAPMEEEDCIC